MDATCFHPLSLAISLISHSFSICSSLCDIEKSSDQGGANKLYASLFGSGVWIGGEYVSKEFLARSLILVSLPSSFSISSIGDFVCPLTLCSWHVLAAWRKERVGAFADTSSSLQTRRALIATYDKRIAPTWTSGRGSLTWQHRYHWISLPRLLGHQPTSWIHLYELSSHCWQCNIRFWVQEVCAQYG